MFNTHRRRRSSKVIHKNENENENEFNPYLIGALGVGTLGAIFIATKGFSTKWTEKVIK